MIGIETYKNLDYVREMAKGQAQKLGVDMAIYTTKIQGHEVFQITETTNPAAGTVEIVRYAKPVDDKAVLRDNENVEPELVEEKPKVKGKRGVVVEDVE
jgi:predicted transcriptional regulator